MLVCFCAFYYSDCDKRQGIWLNIPVGVVVRLIPLGFHLLCFGFGAISCSGFSYKITRNHKLVLLCLTMLLEVASSSSSTVRMLFMVTTYDRPTTRALMCTVGFYKPLLAWRFILEFTEPRELDV